MSGSHDDAELIERVTRPLRIFARHKLAGAGLLLAATLVALAWANSPASGLYHELLDLVLTVSLESFGISKPLLLWINDGLMGIFFFVVGLEIKRELLAGELSSPRKALLPAAGALGGMVVPALVYLGLNAGGPGGHGWGIPMATDIAFALGMLALLGSRVPPGLRVFLTALAIVDDIGAIVVIAVFYTDQIALASLALGGLFTAVSIASNLAGVRSSLWYFALGTLVWVSFLKSGVHATLASVLMAMTIPVRTRIDGEGLLARLGALTRALRDTGIPRGRGLVSSRQHRLIHEMETTLGKATAPLQRLEHALAPVTAFFVLPVFALANAGVELGGGAARALGDPICHGIVLGLLLGKPVGIVAFAWLSVRLGWASLPEGVDWLQVTGTGVLAGIGFTMSLFIGSLAFDTAELRNVAKLGVLSASLLSALVGSLLLALATRRRA